MKLEKRGVVLKQLGEGCLRPTGKQTFGAARLPSIGIIIIIMHNNNNNKVVSCQRILLAVRRRTSTTVRGGNVKNASSDFVWGELQSDRDDSSPGMRWLRIVELFVNERKRNCG
jgi:hypothetical protein